MPCPQPIPKYGDLRRGLASVAFDEHGACGAGQPANAGPRRHFGLGHEIDALGRVQRKDIKPRRMVGNHRARSAHRLPLAVVSHAQQDKR